jgi:hypothetical protein
MQSNELKSSRLSEVGSARLPYSRMRRPFLRALRGALSARQFKQRVQL